jgi:tetratricopeptide (TPR) repeat protein
VGIGLIPAWQSIRQTYFLEQARRDLASAEFDAALDCLAKVQDTNERCAEAYYLAAVAHRRAGHYEIVPLYLNNARDLGWNEDDVTRQSLLTLFQAGDLEGAKPGLERLLQSGNLSDLAAEEIYEGMAKGYLSSYRISEALGCIHYWLEWQPQAIAPRLWRADQWEKGNNNRGAKSEYETILSFAPTCIEARSRLASMVLKENKVEEALGHFQQVVAVEPDNHVALLGVADCLTRLTRVEEATATIDRVLEMPLTPEYRCAALVARGKIELGRGDVSAAGKTLDEAVKTAPNLPEPHYLLSLTLTRSGETAEAQRHLDRSKEIQDKMKRLAELTGLLSDSPGNADMRYEVGMLLTEHGLADEGSAWLATALQFDPTHRKTHLALASYYASKGKRQLAGKHRRLAAESPDRPLVPVTAPGSSNPLSSPVQAESADASLQR